MSAIIGLVGSGMVRIQKWYDRLMIRAEGYEMVRHMRKYPSTIYISQVRDFLNEHGLSATDVRTTEEEIERLSRLYCLKNARVWLDWYRRKPDQYPEHNFKQLINFWLDEGRLSLQDIGTTEEELEALQQKGYRLVTQNYIAAFQKESTVWAVWPEKFLQVIFDEVAKINPPATLEDFGTSEEELRELCAYWMEPERHEKVQKAYWDQHMRQSQFSMGFMDGLMKGFKKNKK